MKKIPTLFQRNYEGDRLIRNEVVPGCEWVLAGEGVATEKIDGTCCRVKDWQYFKRYELKKGKVAPTDFVPAQEADAVTGDITGWMPISSSNPADQYHCEAMSANPALPDGTYELIGPKVQGNIYQLIGHMFVRHGANVFEPQPPITFDELKQWLEETHVEGIVWHHPDGRMCKIKRRDFGFKWPEKK